LTRVLQYFPIFSLKMLSTISALFKLHYYGKVMQLNIYFVYHLCIHVYVLPRFLYDCFTFVHYNFCFTKTCNKKIIIVLQYIYVLSLFHVCSLFLQYRCQLFSVINNNNSIIIKYKWTRKWNQKNPENNYI